jgi:hypothetical protein
MIFIKIINILFLVFQITFAQTIETIPIGFVKLEGIEYAGKITFYLEKKTQTKLAYQNGKVKWKKEVTKVCGQPIVGKSEIREIRIQKNYLKIVYRKHSFAEIEVQTGKVICEGQD